MKRILELAAAMLIAHATVIFLMVCAAGVGGFLGVLLMFGAVR